MTNIFEIKPKDIKNMSIEELEILAKEIREFLVDSISKTGGHLSSNLGVVELTLAMFKVFDFDQDKIVWDVGHQSYVYKILTGRARDFKNLRQLKGLSGFPKVEESKYDFFDTGHSSNSISVVTGMITGRDINKEEYNIIGVIGDGSLTGGMAYEGLNNLGAMKKHGIIILNDNGMSIGANTGSINNHLTKLRTSKGYTRFKHNMRDALIKIPKVGNRIYKSLDRMKDTIKAGLVKGIIFEEMGFTYLGPIDGHDLKKLIKTFQLAKEAEEPVLVHASTIKGRGYSFAKENPDKFHGTAPFNVETGELLSKSDKLSYSNVAGNKITELARKDKNIVVVSAAMIEGTGLLGFQNEFPERTFDVGIAEQHAITFSAGMAKEGAKPFVAIYSSFLQRAYDQIIMDVALQNAPVVICIDRAGCVGADGETHHGIFDLSFLSHIPNLTVLTPSSKEGLEKALEKACEAKSPVAIRYPRGNALPEENIINTKGEKDVVILAVGTMLENALKAKKELEKEEINTRLYKVEQVKPIEKEQIIKQVADSNLVVTIEDNVVTGGFGQQVSQILEFKNKSLRVVNMGWQDEFVQQGTQNELMELYGLDGKSIKDKILKEIKVIG